MSLRTQTDYERGLPNTRPLIGDDGPGVDTKGSDRGGSRGGGKWFCGPNWQLTGIFWVVLLSVIGSFTLVGLVASSGELQQTSRATVSMHQETIQMRENTEAWIKKIKDHFPPNQETVTAEQILDSIDKVHALTAWADQVSRSVTPAAVQGIVANAQRLLGNATLLVEVLSAAFSPPSTAAGQSARSVEVNNVATIVRRGAELAASVSTADFHAGIATVGSALQSFVRVSQHVDPEKVGKIVNSASDILSSADSEHIIKVISELSRGASDVIHRLAAPGGLRVTLPVGLAEAPSKEVRK